MSRPVPPADLQRSGRCVDQHASTADSNPTAGGICSVVAERGEVVERKGLSEAGRW